MRFLFFGLITLASYNGFANTTLTLNGQGFGLTATLNFDQGNNAHGTVIANTITSGLCLGKFFQYHDDEGLILVVSFSDDASDRRYCKGNETTIVIKSDRIDALNQGKEVRVTYKSAIQLLMDLKGTLKLKSSP